MNCLMLSFYHRFNVRTSLHVISSFLLVPSRGAGARYAQGGELFALLKLNNELSSDTMGGRLILNNCNSALLAKVNGDKADLTVYEALIEEKSKDAIYFRFSKKCVEELNVKADDMVEVELQFQLNRYGCYSNRKVLQCDSCLHWCLGKVDKGGGS